MLEEKSKELKLNRIAEQLDMWLQEAARHEWSYNDFLLKLCQEELSNKQEKLILLPFVRHNEESYKERITYNSGV